MAQMTGDNSKQYIVTGQQLTNIADAIDKRGGASEPMTVDDMPQAIKNIPDSIKVDESASKNIQVDFDGKTMQYTITPDTGYGAMRQAVANVTVPDIDASVIKNGVTVLSTTGTYDPLSTEIVISSTNDHTFIASPEAPNSTSISVYPPEGKYGMQEATVWVDVDECTDWHIIGTNRPVGIGRDGGTDLVYGQVKFTDSNGSDNCANKWIRTGNAGATHDVILELPSGNTTLNAYYAVGGEYFYANMPVTAGEVWIGSGSGELDVQLLNSCYAGTVFKKIDLKSKIPANSIVSGKSILGIQGTAEVQYTIGAAGNFYYGGANSPTWLNDNTCLHNDTIYFGCEYAGQDRNMNIMSYVGSINFDY